MASTAFFLAPAGSSAGVLSLDATRRVVSRVDAANTTGWVTAFSEQVVVSGKVYVEGVFEVLNNPAGGMFGLMPTEGGFNYTRVAGYSGFGGSSLQASGFQKVWAQNGNPYDAPAAMSQGAVIGMAADVAAGLIWFRDAAGVWGPTTRDAGGNLVPADPATGKGGYDLGRDRASFWVTVSIYEAGSRFRLVSDRAELSYPVPAGFIVVGETAGSPPGYSFVMA